MPSKPETLFNNLKKAKIKIQQKEIPVKPKLTLDLDDVLVNTTKEAQLRVKHCLIPSFNVCQTPLEDFNELQNFPNLEFSLPIPVHVAPKHCQRVDMCHRRTLARSSYRKRLLMGRTTFLSAIKKNRKLRTLQKKNIYHNTIYETAERLERNPDPYFNGSYDYYYTGGNLCVLPEKSYIVHVGGEKLQDIYISRFSKKKHIPENPLRNLYIGIDACSSEIFEVQSFRSNLESRTNCFLSRQKKFITLHSYRGETKLKTVTQFKSDSTPFISFAQSKVDSNQIVVSNMKQHLRIYDLETGKPTLQKICDGAVDTSINNMVQWNTIKPWRDSTYLYANSKALYLMDVRISSKEWRKNGCHFGENEFFCENISSLALSGFENLFYVGGSHKLYCLDARNWQRNFESKNTICRWTHQLEYPPLMVDSFRCSNSEFVSLSSAVAGEMHVCELMRCEKAHYVKEEEQPVTSEYTYKSLSLPYQPPTLMEAYNHARINGKCLLPEADLKKRLSCCTTGLTYYMNPSHKHQQTLLLTSNSNGDVFGHKLNSRESQAYKPRTSEFTDEIVCKYEDKIRHLTQPILNYTDVADMKAMSKVFRCTALSELKTEDSADDSEEKNSVDATKSKRPCNLGRWQKSMKALHNYKDALAKDILSIWDIEYDDDDMKDIKLSDLPKSDRVKPDPEDLVSNWLRTTTAETPMVKIPIESYEDSAASHSNVIKLNTSSALIDVSLNMEAFDSMVEDLPQSTQLFDNSTTQQLSLCEQSALVTNSFNASKKSTTLKKKKTKYIKGF